MKGNLSDLTHLGTLSYTARRQSGTTSRAVKKKTVIYWKEKDATKRRTAMKELGIGSMSVNGESEYGGSLDKLMPYLQNGMIMLRTKVG